LSEKSEFVHALDAAGVTFIGPSEPSMAAMGDKIESKQLAKRSGVSIIPGFNGVVKDVEHAMSIGVVTIKL
jgi:propionyl-CoA carboxylase alpha chain